MCGFYWTPARELLTKEEKQLSLGDVSRFLSKSGHIRRLQKQYFFLPYKSLHSERYATVPGDISSLGDLCSNQKMFRAVVIVQGYTREVPCTIEGI